MITIKRRQTMGNLAEGNVCGKTQDNSENDYILAQTIFFE